MATTGTAKERMPVLFIGHGNPMNALERNEYTRAWERIAADLQRRHGDPRILQVRPDIRHPASDPDIGPGKVKHRPGRVHPDNPKTGRIPARPQPGQRAVGAVATSSTTAVVGVKTKSSRRMPAPAKKSTGNNVGSNQAKSRRGGCSILRTRLHQECGRAP